MRLISDGGPAWLIIGFEPFLDNSFLLSEKLKFVKV